MTEPTILSSPGSSPPIGQRIREAREAKGMTVRELAEKLGVDPRTVAGYSSASPRSQPRYERLVQIAEILEQPVSYFLGETRAA